MRILYVSLFGLLGVLARYVIGVTATRFHVSTFPYWTFGINVLGAFLIGIVYVLGVEQTVLSQDLRVGVIAGLLGGFTTFSSFCLEAVRLLETGAFGYAALYVGLSNVLGIAASLGGIALTRMFFVPR